MDWRLWIGGVLAFGVIVLLVYGLLFGAERYEASKAAEGVQSEEPLEREGEPPWQREMRPATT